MACLIEEYTPDRHGFEEDGFCTWGELMRKKTVRTQRADGEVTYNRILVAAGELFASVGFAETTSKMIAAEAEVDLASINYHFGSRNGLYQAALTEAHRRLINVGDLERLAASTVPATTKLKKLIEFLVDGATGTERWPVRILGREILAPSSHFLSMQQTEVMPKFRIILPILSEITAIPPDDPALVRCLVSVAAPCAMLLVVGRGPNIFANQILEMPREALVEHLYSFAIGGLGAISQQHQSD